MTARTALARGHERVASLLGRLGDVDGARDAEEARITVLTERRVKHPDRAAVWNDEALAMLSAAQRSLDLLESRRESIQRADVQRERALLDRLVALESRSRRLNRALPVSAQDVRESFARCDRLVNH